MSTIWNFARILLSCQTALGRISKMVSSWHWKGHLASTWNILRNIPVVFLWWDPPKQLININKQQILLVQLRGPRVIPEASGPVCSSCSSRSEVESWLQCRGIFSGQYRFLPTQVGNTREVNGLGFVSMVRMDVGFRRFKLLDIIHEAWRLLEAWHLLSIV